MALGTGIPLSTAFDVFTNRALDARYEAADEAARDAIPDTSRYPGLFCFVLDSRKLFWLRSGITNGHWEEFSLGAIKVVPDEVERLAIPSGDRYEGMLVYQIDTQKTWQLRGGILDGDFREFGGGGSGAGFGGKNLFVDPLYNENVTNTFVYTDRYAKGGSGVTVSGNFVVFTGDQHDFKVGDRVYYIAGIAGAITGLTTGNFYYVAGVSGNSISLSSTKGGSVITLTGPAPDGRHDFARDQYTSGNGPSPSVPCLVASVETVNPMIPNGSLKITYIDPTVEEAQKRCESQGVRLATKKVDREDLGKTLTLKVEVDATDGAYLSDSAQIKIYDKTNSREIFPIGDSLIKDGKNPVYLEIPMSSNTEEINFSIHLVSGITSGDWDLIFGTWELGYQSTVPGLVEQYEEIDLTSIGPFTGGKIAVSKIGRQVTISALETLTHSSSSQPASAAGLLPVWARPADNKANVYWIDTTSSRTIRVLPDGTLDFIYYNSAEPPVGAARTNAGVIPTFSYMVPESNSAVFSTTEIANKTIKFKAFRGSGQTFNNAAVTTLTFTGKQNDDLGIVNNATGVMTFPQSGWVYLDATGVAPLNGIGTFSASIYINGGAYRSRSIITPNTSAPYHSSVTAMFQVNAGDQVTLRFQQNVQNTTLTGYVDVFYLPDFKKWAEYTSGGQILTATSGVKTPVATTHWLAMTNNSITLPTGTWKLSGNGNFNNSGSNPSYMFSALGWFAANGADSGTQPDALSTLPNIEILSNQAPYNQLSHDSSSAVGYDPSPIIVKVTQPTTIFLNAFVTATTPNNARVTVYVNAEKLR